MRLSCSLLKANPRGDPTVEVGLSGPPKGLVGI